MSRSVAVLDQNFIAELADVAVAMHRGQPTTDKWKHVLTRLHEAVNVRKVLACPEAEFTDVESAAGPRFRERNKAINHELAGGLQYRHWVTIIQTQIAIRVTESVGKVPEEELLGLKDVGDRRVYFESTANPPLGDPDLRNLVFRVHWLDEKYGRGEADVRDLEFRARLTREAMNDARVIVPDASWQDHADSVGLYFLMSGPTFQHVYTRWLKARNAYDPVDAEVPRRMLATHRALFPKMAFTSYGALLPPIPWEPPDVGRTDRAFVEMVQSGLLRSVPAFELWGKLIHRMYQDVRASRLPRANDVYDILRVAIMAPPCQVYATDRYVKTLLTDTRIASDNGFQVFELGADADIERLLAWVDGLK